MRSRRRATHPIGDPVTETTPWWVRATGEHLLGVPVIAVYALIGILPIVATIPSGDIPASDRLPWLGVAVLAQVGLSAVALIGGLVVGNRDSTAVRATRVVIVALAGAVRGIIVQVAADSLGLIDPTPALVRVANSSLTVVLWMGLLAILVDAQVEFRRSYREAFARDIAITARITEDDTFERVDEQVRQWSAPVRQHIDEIRDELDTGTSPDRAVGEAADAIRELVAQRLRPLSHRLWFADAGKPPRVRLIPVAGEAISRGPILTPIVLLLLVAGMIIGSLVRYGLLIALTAGGALVALTIVYLAIGRLGVAATPPWRPRIWNLISVPVFSVVAAVVPTEISEAIFGVGADLPTMITITIAIPTLGLLVAMARVTSADRRDLLDAMRDPEAIRVAVRRVREQEAATYLHHHVKSQLTASAIRMREAARSEDVQGVREAADDAAHILTRPIPDAIMLGRQSPRDRLVEIADSWEGIAEVEIDLPADIDDPLLLLIGDIAAEAIANAVRGGGASRVWLHVARTDGRVVLSIRDDGAGGRTLPAETGMGTSWLDAMVPGLWGREAGPDGTVLTVIFPGA